MPTDDRDHRTHTERLIEQDRREEWSATDWERNTGALNYLRAASLDREQSEAALPADVHTVRRRQRAHGRAAAVATKMMILVRKIETVCSHRYHITTFVP